MRARTKICGITNAVDRDAAIEAGADALGFIVDVPVDTPREIGAEGAADLIAGVPPLVSTVLVTMPDGPEEAIDLLADTGADAVQVHGGPPPEGIEAIREATGRKVVVAVDAEAPEKARRYDGVADALLVDSVGDDGGGGTGRTHDWGATRAFRESVETAVILAGGLTPENVAEAVGTVEPFGVDVASGVEREPSERDARRGAEPNEDVEREGGRKDHDAVAAFVANATRRPEAVSG